MGFILKNQTKYPIWLAITVLFGGSFIGCLCMMPDPKKKAERERIRANYIPIHERELKEDITTPEVDLNSALDPLAPIAQFFSVNPGLFTLPSFTRNSMSARESNPKDQ